MFRYILILGSHNRPDLNISGRFTGNKMYPKMYLNLMYGYIRISAFLHYGKGDDLLGGHALSICHVDLRRKEEKYKMKRFMKVFISAIILVAFFAGFHELTKGRAEPLSQTGIQPTANPTIMRTVKVSGTGEIQVAPDTAVIRLGVQTEEKTAQAAISQNNVKMQALMDTLKNAKVAPGDIQTKKIRLAPRYTTNSTNNERTLVGYTATNIVEVRSKDLTALGTLLDQAVNNGANTIESISFIISDSEKLTDQARQNAVQNARHKAEQLAQLTGANLGSVLEIQETSSFPSPVVSQVQPIAQGAEVPVSPGSQSIRVNVQVTWAIADSSNN